MTRRVILTVALLLTAVGCAPIQASPPPTQASAAPAAARPPVEYQLAVADAQQVIDRNDPRIGSYAANLDRLEAHCKEGRVQLGDLAVHTSQVLRERQHPNSALEVLDAANLAIPNEAPEISCIDIFAGLVILVTGT